MLTVKLMLTFWVVVQIMAFIQAFLHKYFGHKPITGFKLLNQIHTLSHHKIYTPNQFETAEYDKNEKNITYAFLIPVGILSSVAYGIFPVEFFIVVVSGSAISYLLQIYLHTHYHLSESWLLRYPWFRRLKALHQIHHIYPDKNYGLINFSFDRVTGTFMNGKSSERFCTNLKPSSDREAR